MRKININDVMDLSEIIDKIDLDLTIEPRTDKKGNKVEMNIDDYGKIIGMRITKSLHKGKKEIIGFLASIFEYDVKEYEKKEIIEIVKEMMEFKEELVKLFTQAMQLMQTMR